MKTPMKYVLPALTIALIGFCGAVFGQEVELTNQPPQPGLDVRVGQTDIAFKPSEFYVHDQQGNLVAQVPLVSGASFSPSNTQITDTLYAVTPPVNNNITAFVIYQANSSQSIQSPAILQAVQDSINHNYYLWAAGAQFTGVQAFSPGVTTLPAGTQFWVCSASGASVACSGSDILSIYGTTVPAETGSP
jgi:hypothetical protein